MAKHSHSIVLGVCWVVASVAVAAAHEHHAYTRYYEPFRFRASSFRDYASPPPVYVAPHSYAAPLSTYPVLWRRHHHHHRARGAFTAAQPIVQAVPLAQPSAGSVADANMPILAAPASSSSLGAWLLAFLGLGAIGAGVLYRQTLERWYYELTPHPAAALINRAIRRNETIDEHQLSALARVLPQNAIERDVRAAQAHRLAERARRHIAELTRETSRESDYASAQADLTSATITHELAHARLDGLQKHTRAI